jgi:hypothetical protein
MEEGSRDSRDCDGGILMEAASKGCNPPDERLPEIRIEISTPSFSEALFLLLLRMLVHVEYNEIVCTGTLGFVPCHVRNYQMPF